MYHYRNKKSGVVIKTTCKVSGKNWELVEDMLPQQSPIEDPPEDDFVEDPFVQDPFAEDPEEETVAEAPPEKPKTSRRGKK